MFRVAHKFIIVKRATKSNLSKDLQRMGHISHGIVDAALAYRIMTWWRSRHVGIILRHLVALPHDNFVQEDGFQV